MATTTRLILAQLETLIKAIAPTKVGELTDKFTLIQGREEPATQAIPSGTARRFMVRLGPGGAEASGFHPSERLIHQRFTVVVLYPIFDDIRELDLAIDEDRAA